MTDRENIARFIVLFPKTFSLRGASRSSVFRISPDLSIVGNKGVIFYTEKLMGDKWITFGPGGTPWEIWEQVDNYNKPSCVECSEPMPLSDLLWTRGKVKGWCSDCSSGVL